ncbi:Indole-3-pyruvate monooxygenase YUCCA2 [Colletotrichum viniferum]|nr:Indole-3-pyruvate monooxygenase YUCCA2 [Colletotrichum viniferum]
MTTITNHRTRTKVADLPSPIPSVPPFPSEANLDVAAEASHFLKALSDAVTNADWPSFADLFVEDSWWRDSLTLTFDKRTILGRAAILRAWESLSPTRSPSTFSPETELKGLQPTFVRLSPTLATLEIPFSFHCAHPATSCTGLAKLIPVTTTSSSTTFKIWGLTTQVHALLSRPFAPLPRPSSSLLPSSQRGRSSAQGLPSLPASTILDAVIVGGSCNGIANAIRLESAGAESIVLDSDPLAGGNWSSSRYASIRLHHPKSMIQLPEYPVPSSLPEFLSGPQLTSYYRAAVEDLRLPFFGGVTVTRNTWSPATNLWTVHLTDTRTSSSTTLLARNLILSTGWLASPSNLNLPRMSPPPPPSFPGPVLHSTSYHTPGPFASKRVLVIGSGNSAHDIAADLALSPLVPSVSILQRSPTVLLDMPAFLPVITSRYNSLPGAPESADFAESALPAGVSRALAQSATRSLMAQHSSRTEKFEEAGYLVDRAPCLISKQLEERGRAFYVDQPGTLELVLDGKIGIERGEARGFAEKGVVVADRDTGAERVVEADAVVFATGFGDVDVPSMWAGSGFVDEETAGRIENVGRIGVDEEGEWIGITTFSGHPNLYFSGVGLIFCRGISRFTAIQVLADIEGVFPERYARSVKE